MTAGGEEEGTRDRILTACMALLREGGSETASQRAICDRAGVKAPTLYHHFGDLGGLQRLAVERAFAEAIARKRSGTEFCSALDRLRQGWDAYLAFARDEPGLFSTLARQVVAGALPNGAMASYRSLVSDLQELEAECGSLRHDPETGAQMLWAAAHGTACLTLAGREGFPVSDTLSSALREATLAAISKGW